MSKHVLQLEGHLTPLSTFLKGVKIKACAFTFFRCIPDFSAICDEKGASQVTEFKKQGVLVIIQQAKLKCS